MTKERKRRRASAVQRACFPIGLSAYNATAILDAAKSKEMLSKVKIVSFDEYPDTLTAIQSGEIHATVVQDPYNFGFKSVEQPAKFAKTGDRSIATNNPIQNIPYRIVAKEAGKDRLEAQAFQAELGRLMGKRSTAVFTCFL